MSEPIRTPELTITNECNMELMSRYEDNYFDLAIVDPPYRDSKDNDMNQWNRKYIENGRLKNWNDKPSKEYFAELIRVSKNQIIWGANNFNLDFKGFIVWDKDISSGMKFSMCEIASLSDSLSTVSKMVKIRCQNADNVRIHPTQKPVALYKWILDKYAKQGDKILDTHLGSGSIAIACHDYGFDLTACELDKEYYDKAIQRIKDHTNQLTMF
jgi:site-specific DNA-methyltransferase (adenine-specific)